jgi:hypothetical protein
VAAAQLPHDRSNEGGWTRELGRGRRTRKKKKKREKKGTTRDEFFSSQSSGISVRCLKDYFSLCLVSRLLSAFY